MVRVDVSQGVELVGVGAHVFKIQYFHPVSGRFEFFSRGGAYFAFRVCYRVVHVPVFKVGKNV